MLLATTIAPIAPAVVITDPITGACEAIKDNSATAAPLATPTLNLGKYELLLLTGSILPFVLKLPFATYAAVIATLRSL
jgi:hypothetical protein